MGVGKLLISEDRTVGDLVTIEDFEDAEASLDELIDKMEAQIETAKLRMDLGEDVDPDWYHRVTKAVKMRMRARRVVQKKLAAFAAEQKAVDDRRRERILVDILKERYPVQFEKCFKVAHTRNPDLFYEVDVLSV